MADFTAIMEPKERILQKAADLFFRYGIRSVTMDEIAGQLGISKKTIYQYYTDKDEIVEGIIDREIVQNECKCDMYFSNSENAVHEIILSLDGMEEMLKATNPLIMYDLEKHHIKAHKKFKNHTGQFWYNIIVDNLERGIKEGLYRPELNKDIVAKYRIESVFISFNQDMFPHNKYMITDVGREIGTLFLYSIATQQGVEMIEKYRQQAKENKHKLYV